MKNIYKTLTLCIMLGLFAMTFSALAGNRDRSGQSGAQHLLIDPWARSAGWGSCGVAETRGLESVFSNVAGLAFVKKTDIAYSRTQYLTGSGGGLGVNAFGVAQGISSKNKETGRRVDLGTLAISVFSMGFGDLQVTTADQPDGTNAIFSPKLNYIAVHYAKSFNRFIHGGISLKIVNESVTDVRANGLAIDIGVQYLAGAYENFKIGVTVQNLGLPMSYKGDGISFRAKPVGSTYPEASVEWRQAQYELPALLCLGLSYDFLIFSDEYQQMKKEDRKAEGLTRKDAVHRVTLAGSFTANAYSRDQFALGLEYGFMRYFAVRAGYIIQNVQKNTDNDRIYINNETMYLGPSAGVSFGVPLSKKGNQLLQFDYAYRFTNFWKGNHYIGVKISL